MPVADRRTVFYYSYLKLVSLTSCWTASSSFGKDNFLYLVAAYRLAQFTPFYAPNFSVSRHCLSEEGAQMADFGVLKRPNRTNGLRLTLFDRCHA
jgi:hypothetical protein